MLLQTDFGYFGPPEEHFQWTQEEREATYITPEDPSSEICGEVAAAFAASSLALRDTGKPRASFERPATSWLACQTHFADVYTSGPERRKRM